MAIYAIREGSADGRKGSNLLADSTGWVYDPEGIDLAALKEIKEVKRARLYRISELSDQMRNTMKAKAYGA
ncbi:MAG: hypothetical protein ACLVC1_10560 [Mediterraneibacter gnavus]